MSILQRTSGRNSSSLFIWRQLRTFSFKSSIVMATSTDGSVALAAFTAATLGHQVLSLANSTLKFAASALRFQNQKVQVTSSWQSLPVYSLSEVSNHCYDDDCWLVIYDKIYDLTDFLNKHPGGYDVLVEYAGRDATLAFRSVGHTEQGLDDMDRYLIGILPENERIYIRNTSAY